MGQTQYYLIDTNCFDSLYSLITHYRNHPLRSQVRINKLNKLRIVINFVFIIVLLIDNFFELNK